MASARLNPPRLRKLFSHTCLSIPKLVCYIGLWSVHYMKCKTRVERGPRSVGWRYKQ